MIANFFKQSKPIVFLILGIILSLLFYLKIILSNKFSVNGENIPVILLNHIVLVLSFVLFELSIKHYEIQKGHSLMSLFFVLFTSFIVPGIGFSYELSGFLILSLGIIRLLSITKNIDTNLRFYEAVLLITIASLFYKPFILCLVLVLVASLLFSTPKWRYFIIPFLSISTVVIFVESYYLIIYDSVVGLHGFIPKIEYSIEEYYSKLNPILTIFWLISSLICLYQIFSVKRIRSLYHRNMASFFLIFLILALLSMGFESSTLSGLWLMSIWPLCIYLGDFISRIKKQLWLQIGFWFFVIGSISIYIFSL